MSVITIDLRTTYTDGDSFDVNWNIGLLDTAIYAEAIGSISVGYNIETGQIFYTNPVGSIDISSTLLYVYSSCNALQNSWTTGAHSLYISDGTDQLALHQAGGDKDVFKHADGPVAFQSFVIDGSYFDTKIIAGEYTVIAGDTSLVTTAITAIGGHYITQSKALGGGTNCWIDVIKYGNDGIRIYGGTTGARGTFLEIVIDDRSTANSKAFGLIREYSTGVYGCQGPLNFGDSVGVSWFEDSNISLIFENRDISNDKYYIHVMGDTTVGDSTHFILDSVSITTAGPNVSCDFYSGGSSLYGIDELSITNSNFANLGDSIIFSGDSFGFYHTVTDNIFNGAGQINPGTVIFQNNTILNSNYALGSVLLNSNGTSNWSGLDFISGDSGHAIYISAIGSYTFQNFNFTGYASTNGSTGKESVYNNSGGAVTITVNGGTTPTIRNGTSASTTILTGAVTTQLKVTDIESGDSLAGAMVLIWVADSSNFPYLDTVTASTGDTSGDSVLIYHVSHGLATGDDVIIRGANEDVYNGAYSITVISGDTYTYTTNEAILISPATETITATFAFINEETSATGTVTDSRPVPINQSILGWVREADGSPYYYKSQPVVGTVDSSSGFSATIQLIRDE